MQLPSDLTELLAEFASAGVEFVIVGGYAVAFHARPRATKDIDLLLLGDPDNLVRAAGALERFGAPVGVVEATKSLAENEIVYFGQPPMRVDLLRSIEGVESSTVFANAITTTLAGVIVRVIAREDLVANKKKAGRAQDLLDVELLERVGRRSRQ